MDTSLNPCAVSMAQPHEACCETMSFVVGRRQVQQRRPSDDKQGLVALSPRERPARSGTKRENR